jgi:hypothetical protein
VTEPKEPNLPPGYRLDKSDPDVWALRRSEGLVAAYFSARGATEEAIEQGMARLRGRRRMPVRKTHDYVHYYRGYWSDGGKCRIRIYREDGQSPVVICSQRPDSPNTSVTNMAEYIAACL